MRKISRITGGAIFGTTVVLVTAWFAGGDVGLSRIGSVMTAVGLVLSVYVAAAVTEIRRRYVRQAMLKNCHERLQSCRRNLKTAVTRNEPEAAFTQISLARTIIQRVREHASVREGRTWPIDELESLLQLPKLQILERAPDAQTSMSAWVLFLELDLTELELDHRDG